MLTEPPGGAPRHSQTRWDSREAARCPYGNVAKIRYTICENQVRLPIGRHFDGIEQRDAELQWVTGENKILLFSV